VYSLYIPETNDLFTSHCGYWKWVKWTMCIALLVLYPLVSKPVLIFLKGRKKHPSQVLFGHKENLTNFYWQKKVKG